MILLLLNDYVPVDLRGKTWVMNTIQQKAPVGRKTYGWWLNFFQNVLRDNWDA